MQDREKVLHQTLSKRSSCYKHLMRRKNLLTVVVSSSRNSGRLITGIKAYFVFLILEKQLSHSERQNALEISLLKITI